MNDTRLELDHHAGFQRWEWVAQRIGWGVLIAIIGTALTVRSATVHSPMPRQDRPTVPWTFVTNEWLASGRETIMVTCLTRGDSGRLGSRAMPRKSSISKRVEPEPARVEGDPAATRVYVFGRPASTCW